MNNYKHLKPNLLDPIIRKKIMKTLNPPRQDYWAPAKLNCRSFYENYMKPNVGLVIVIIIIILFLLYRYRVIKKERDNRELEKILETDEPLLSSIQVVTNNSGPPAKIQNQKNTAKNLSKKELDDYTNLVLQLYGQEKEKLREPSPRYNHSNAGHNQSSPKFAYPMYPYAKGGTLAPSGR